MKNFEINTFFCCRYTGTVTRSVCGNFYESAPPTDASGGCRTCPILAKDLLDICCVSMWRSLLSEPTSSESSSVSELALVPTSVSLNGKDILDCDTVIEALESDKTVPEIVVMCDKIAPKQLAELARRLKRVQVQLIRKLRY